MKNISSYYTGLRTVAEAKSIKLSENTIRNKDNTTNYLRTLGDFTSFTFKIAREIFSPPIEGREILRQCYEIGNKSFFLVSITGLIMGLVLTIQSRPVLADFGAESWLPNMVAISLIREIAPVITALICAGKIGSGIGAELGSMKVTEQIDAMEVSATNPIKYLLASRVIATTVMIPILVFFAIAAGLIGSYLGVNIKGDVSWILFISQAFSSVDFFDLLPTIIKSIAFGGIIGLVGCYQGYNSGRGTESVGKAANSAVVISSLLVFIIDVIVVQITDAFIS